MAGPRQQSRTAPPPPPPPRQQSLIAGPLQTVLLGRPQQTLESPLGILSEGSVLWYTYICSVWVDVFTRWEWGTGRLWMAFIPGVMWWLFNATLPLSGAMKNDVSTVMTEGLGAPIIDGMPVPTLSHSWCTFDVSESIFIYFLLGLLPVSRPTLFFFIFCCCHE